MLHDAIPALLRLRDHHEPQALEERAYRLVVTHELLDHAAAVRPDDLGDGRARPFGSGAVAALDLAKHATDVDGVINRGGDDQGDEDGRDGPPPTGKARFDELPPDPDCSRRSCC
jgi:hypothetical protein